MSRESFEQTIKPDYYQTANGKDLFAMFEEGLLSEEEYVGFLKGNIFKYVKRYDQKNGLEDLRKAQTYLDMLIEIVEMKDNG